MNSGKVRLNSGILERRHSRWGKALHHFRMARQIDDTYCEPDYWIGATLLQQGNNLDLALWVGSPSSSSLFVSLEQLVTLAPPTPPAPLPSTLPCRHQLILFSLLSLLALVVLTMVVNASYTILVS